MRDAYHGAKLTIIQTLVFFNFQILQTVKCRNFNT